MQIAPIEPTVAFFRLVKLREMLRRMRDERVQHPSISVATREFVGDYYGDMMEALDIAMNSVMTVHHLKIEPNLLEQAIEAQAHPQEARAQ